MTNSNHPHMSRRQRGNLHLLRARRSALPAIAPHESCTRCHKGDTTTGFASYGDAEWLPVGLQLDAGLPPEEATDLAGRFRGDTPPSEKCLHVIRLCRACARTTDVLVTSLASIDA